MLRFAEELMLLLLEVEDGRFAATDRPALHLALAGSVLMDLALEARIDTGLRKLVLIDPTPTGDDLLDPILAEITGASGEHDVQYWLQEAASRGAEIRDRASARLIEQGYLLRRGGGGRGSVRRRQLSRPQPVVDGAATRQIKAHITNLLLSDDLPDPRDVVVICLCDVCGLFENLLLPDELERLQPRIRQLGKLDLIAQAVFALVAPERTDSSQPLQSLIAGRLGTSEGG